MLIQSSLMLAVLLMLRPLLKRKLSPRMLYALWFLPALRMTLPFEFPSLLSVPGSAVNSYMTQAHAALNTPLNPSRLAMSIAPSASDPMQTAALPVSGSVTPAQILLFIYFTGVAIVLLCILISNFRFARRIRKGLIKIQIDAPLPVYLSSGIDSPCLWGILRPRILLTSQCMQNPTLAHVALYHELAHYRQKDPFWNLWRSLLLCAYWFNPLVWVAAKLSRRDSEKACDQRVLRNTSARARQTYGLALLQLSCPERLILVTGSGISSSRQALKERIQLISRGGSLKGGRAVFCLALVLLIGLTICTSGLKFGIPVSAQAESEVQPSALPSEEASEVQAAPVPTEDSPAVIGGADGPTSIYISSDTMPLSLIESMAPWTEFQDMEDSALQETLNKLGDIKDSYIFTGRVSKDGQYGYILGFLKAQESPLKGLSVAIDESENGQIIYLRSQSEYSGEESVQSEPETQYTLTDLGLINYDIDNPQLLYIEPQGYSATMWPVFERLLSGDVAYLEDAQSRGVTPLCPPEPYIEVSKLQDGVYYEEYIPLTEAEVQSAAASSSTYQPQDGTDDYTIRVVAPDLASTEDGSVPESIYQIAARRCNLHATQSHGTSSARHEGRNNSHSHGRGGHE